MNLPEDDEVFLNGKRFEWSVTEEGEGRGFLLVKAYRVNGDRYDRPVTDLMIRIPAQYNMAKLDMWYVDPVLRLKSGSFPPAADHMESYMNRTWQRFSRHLPEGAWRAGVDGLPMFFTFINAEFQR